MLSIILQSYGNFPSSPSEEWDQKWPLNHHEWILQSSGGGTAQL